MVMCVYFNNQCYLIALLIVTATLGDFLVYHSKLQLYKAVFDNTTHAVIGGISWLLISFQNKNHHHPYQTLIEVLICTLIASFIDLDHFFVARSLRLKDATNLQNRPFLHSSTLPLCLSVVVLINAYFLQIKWLQKYVLIFFTAFASHHTRDATRRGFWFSPFGSTPPIPYLLYIFITILIPYLVAFLFKHMKIDKVYQYTEMNV